MSDPKSSPGIFKALLFYFTVGWPEWKLALIVALVVVFCAIPILLVITFRMGLITSEEVLFYGVLNSIGMVLTFIALTRLKVFK